MDIMGDFNDTPRKSAGSRPAKRKIGLALSSGMARGWAHIGAIRALKRLGFEFDIVAGCSVGALAGGCYLAGKLDNLETWARSLSRSRIIGYLDMRLRSGGLIGGERLMEEMRKHLGTIKIEELRGPYVAVTTDMITGHEIWLQQGDLAEAMRASFSLPGIFPPVRMMGRWLVDGALVNPLPVTVCRALGADMVIAVNLSADIIGKSRQNDTNISTAAGMDVLRTMDETEENGKETMFEKMARLMFKRGYDAPSIFGTMTSALNIMQDRITRARLAGDPPDVHIAPRLGHIGLLEFDRTDEAIHEGEAAVMRKRPELADALQVLAHSAREPQQ